MTVLHGIYKSVKLHWRAFQITHNRKKTVVVDLPHIAYSPNADAKTLYKYYWFADNLQQYATYLVRILRYGVIVSPQFAVMPLNIHSLDDYMKDCIKSPERALIRKSLKNSFEAREINYDEYIEEIKEINTSKLERLGREMSKDYINPRLRDKVVKLFNPDIYTFGCFTAQGKLVGYYMFERFTNFYHVVKGIGHSEYLSFGIMNYLFAYSVVELAKRNDCQMLIYGAIDSDLHAGGLSRFKRNVGCDVKQLVYKGTLDDFRNLKEFNARYVLHDDSALNYVHEYILD